MSDGLIRYLAQQVEAARQAHAVALRALQQAEQLQWEARSLRARLEIITKARNEVQL